jgi:hypothetical protein
MNTGSGIPKFSDGELFTIGPDVYIEYKLPTKSWRDVCLNGVRLDDVMYFRSHPPSLRSLLRFNEKRVPRRPYKKKEGLNDCENCESCGNPIDPFVTSIVFFRQSNGLKRATCLDCRDEYLWSEDNCSEPSDDGDCYCDSCIRRPSDYDYCSAIRLLCQNVQR